MRECETDKTIYMTRRKKQDEKNKKRESKANIWKLVSQLWRRKSSLLLPKQWFLDSQRVLLQCFHRHHRCYFHYSCCLRVSVFHSLTKHTIILWLLLMGNREISLLRFQSLLGVSTRMQIRLNVSQRCDSDLTKIVSLCRSVSRPKSKW